MIRTKADWNHNTHYHNFLLRQIPGSRKDALDVGSGLGLFAYRLSSLFEKVYCLEPDKTSIDVSRSRCGNRNNIVYINDDFLECDFEDRKFDFISAIASIHHMDFEPALKKSVSLLKPGGRIVILGLYRESSMADMLISLIAIAPNFLMNLFTRKGSSREGDMVTTRAEMSIKEIKAAAGSVLKKYRFRRHLFWRYSILFENNC